MAYVLTRPLGATLGDTLTKPYKNAGLQLGRPVSSLTIALIMIVGQRDVASQDGMRRGAGVTPIATARRHRPLPADAVLTHA